MLKSYFEDNKNFGADILHLGNEIKLKPYFFSRPYGCISEIKFNFSDRDDKIVIFYELIFLRVLFFFIFIYIHFIISNLCGIDGYDKFVIYLLPLIFLAVICLLFILWIKCTLKKIYSF